MIAWKPVNYRIKTASARLRSFIPCELVNKRGCSAEIFSESNLSSYSSVIFQKAYKESDIQYARKLKMQGSSIIFDLCDNHFIQYKDDGESPDTFRRLNNMIELADVITVPTLELSEKLSGKKIIQVPDAVDRLPEGVPYLKARTLIRKLFNQRYETDNTIKLLWFGNAGERNPPWGMLDLLTITPVLNKINRDIPVTLDVISNDFKKYQEVSKEFDFHSTFYSWSYYSFSWLATSRDITIIPASINEFTQGKTSNRVITSLNHNLPVIADQLPSYKEFEEYIRFADWEKNIIEYALDADERRRDVAKGKQYIHDNYNDNLIADKWISAINLANQ